MAGSKMRKKVGEKRKREGQKRERKRSPPPPPPSVGELWATGRKGRP